MSILTVFHQLDLIVTVAADVTVLYWAVPAYKRTKHRGFMLWSIAALLGLWNILTRYTLGADFHANPVGFTLVTYTHRIIWVFQAAIATTGTVILIRRYLIMFDAAQKLQLPPSDPQ